MFTLYYDNGAQRKWIFPYSSHFVEYLLSSIILCILGIFRWSLDQIDIVLENYVDFPDKIFSVTFIGVSIPQYNLWVHLSIHPLSIYMESMCKDHFGKHSSICIHYIYVVYIICFSKHEKLSYLQNIRIPSVVVEKGQFSPWH